jgi:hypothetical protein
MEEVGRRIRRKHWFFGSRMIYYRLHACNATGCWYLTENGKPGRLQSYEDAMLELNVMASLRDGAEPL